MNKQNKNRISSGMRIFILAMSTGLVFLILFAVLNYVILSNSAVNFNIESTAETVILLVTTALVVSFLLGLCLWYGMSKLLSFFMKRLISDMKQICEGGKLSFTTRKHTKDDPISMLYEYFSRIIGATDELLNDINEISVRYNDGDTGVKLDPIKYKGAYYGAAQNVNTMIDLGGVRGRHGVV